MRRFSLVLMVLAACAVLACSKKKDTVSPSPTGTLQGVAQTAVGDTVLSGVHVATSPATSSVSTDSQGHYSIADIPGGQYAVTGTKSGYTPYTVSVSVVGGQTTTADITMTRPVSTSGSIRGQVRTAAGDTLIAGASVVTSPPTASIITDAQGRYVIPEVQPGQYIVTATKGGYDPSTINVSVVAGQATTADVLMTRTGQTLPPEGTIQGQVRTGVGDTLIVGARVVTAPPTSSVTTDQHGTYAILHAPAGQYTVTATKTGYNPGHIDIAVVSAQTTTADIRLTRIDINTPPYEPELQQPANGAIGQPNSLTCRWSGDDPDDDPLTYDLYCDTLALPVLRLAENQEGTTYDLVGLRGNETYFWRVVARDDRGGSTPSAVSSFTTRPDSIPVIGLVAHYPLNGTAIEASGNGNDGVVYGATPVPDRHGNREAALYFNGVDSYVDCGDPSSGSLDMPTDVNFAISVWFRTDQLSQQYPMIISKETYGSNNRLGYNVFLNQGVPPGVCAEVWLGRTQYGNCPAGPGVNDNAWHHLVLVRGGFVLTVYFDGAKVKDSPCTNQDISNAGHFVIGKHSSNTAIARFRGSVDDLRIYKRALSMDEVRALYLE